MWHFVLLVDCRNDTLAGPLGRRGDQVAGPYIMHKDDLKQMAPLWLNYSYAVRNDSRVSCEQWPTAEGHGSPCYHHI
jgi:hypothetical protein